MAGKAITGSTQKRLNTAGEDLIFASYIRHRHVKHMLRDLEPKIGKMSKRMFYDWLHADKSDGRWVRWKDTLKIVAADLAEEALTIADGSDPETVRVARLRIEQRRWMAERYDRESFGRADINMVVGISADKEFLVALKAVDEKAKAKREEIAEADYEIIEDDS